MAKTGEKSVHELTVADIEGTGLGNSDAVEIYDDLRRIVEVTHGLVEQWSRISQELLVPEHPFALHRLLYHSCFRNWDSELLGPAPAWAPTL